jgi:hypothetical protein
MGEISLALMKIQVVLKALDKPNAPRLLLRHNRPLAPLRDPCAIPSLIRALRCRTDTISRTDLNSEKKMIGVPRATRRGTCSPFRDTRVSYESKVLFKHRFLLVVYYSLPYKKPMFEPNLPENPPRPLRSPAGAPPHAQPFFTGTL